MVPVVLVRVVDDVVVVLLEGVRRVLGVPLLEDREPVEVRGAAACDLVVGLQVDDAVAA
jgi:hypothetical protein